LSALRACTPRRRPLTEQPRRHGAALGPVACALGWLVLLAHAPVHGAGLAPLATANGTVPPSPWAYAGLPQQTLPATRFAVGQPEGQPALRIEARASYGNLVHPLAGATAGELRWRWRVEQPVAAADLRTRAGDDVALKVCALFDMPREKVPFVERQLLRLAESRLGEALPSATLCYVWDPAWPRGSVVPNAFSPRVRYITLGAPGSQWQAERQDLAADFLRAFGDESKAVPPLLAIAVGADADNTGGQSIGWIADLQHQVAR
jgi:hypothetical protein